MERVNLDALEATLAVVANNALPALIAEVRGLRQEAERARWCEEMKAEVQWCSSREVWVVEVGLWACSRSDRNAAIDAARGDKRT